MYAQAIEKIERTKESKTELKHNPLDRDTVVEHFSILTVA